MLTFDDEGLTDVTFGAGRTMLTLVDDVWNDAEFGAGRTMLTLADDVRNEAELAAESVRLTKARGIAATTLGNLALPAELLELLELELLLRELFDIGKFLRAPKY